MDIKIKCEIEYNAMHGYLKGILFLRKCSDLAPMHLPTKFEKSLFLYVAMYLQNK